MSERLSVATAAVDECESSQRFELFCWLPKGHRGKHYDIEDGYWAEDAPPT